MTVNELIQICQDRSAWNDSNYRTRWKTFLTTAFREHARRYPWKGLEDEVDVVASSRFLVLPYYVDTVVSILNTTDHSPVSRSGDFDRRSPVTYSQGTTGRVAEWDTLGDVPALAKPSGYVWFSSTHPSDINTVYLTGLVAQSGASGTALSETIQNLSVTSSGTSPVTLSALFTRLLSVAKASDTNGDFFFFDAGNANAHLSFIPADGHSARFRRIQLRFVPSANTTLRIRFRHLPPPLRDDDQGLPPGVSPDFIVAHALALHAREQENFAQAQILFQEANAVLANEANKEENFEEPYSRLIPEYDAPDDPDSDDFAGWLY